LRASQLYPYSLLISYSKHLPDDFQAKMCNHEVSTTQLNIKKHSLGSDEETEKSGLINAL
ncbi:hypothetical protein, partial [Shewanella septentrionalis]